MRKLCLTLLGILILVTSITHAQVNQPPSAPPALAYDPTTHQAVYLEDGEIKAIATEGNARLLTFGQIDNEPVVLNLLNPTTLNIMSVNGDNQTLNLNKAFRITPILLDDTIYYYPIPEVAEDFGDTHYQIGTIASLDIITGESATAGLALVSDGCAGMAINHPEEIIWQESGGFGSKRALERIETEAFNGFIGTLNACDQGVYASEFGAETADGIRILSTDMVDWAVSPDGSRVVGTQFVSIDMVDVVIIDILTGEQQVVATGNYDRVAWLDDTELLVGKRTATDSFLVDKMTAEEATLYGSTIPETPNLTPVYDVRLVKIDVETGQESAFTSSFPDAYSFLRAYVYDDSIYMAIVPDGSAYATALLTAQSTTSEDDDQSAAHLLAPIIYAVDPVTGEFEQISSGYLRWQPFPEARQ